MGHGSEDRIEYCVKMLRRKTDAWEIFYSHQNGLSIEAKDGKVDVFKVSSSEGVGLKVLKDKKIGFSFTSALSKDSLNELVENAVAGSLGVESDEFLSPATTEKKPGGRAVVF